MEELIKESVRNIEFWLTTIAMLLMSLLLDFHLYKANRDDGVGTTIQLWTYIVWALSLVSIVLLAIFYD